MIQAAPDIPSATGLATVLTGIDGVGDRLFERWRGRRAPDLVAATVSNLSDQGVIWPVVAALKARRPGGPRRRAVVALTLAGFTSLGVNRAVKATVGRERPMTAPTEANGPLVRAPTSSSFPSGHTLAATCAALTLAETGPERVLLGGFALAVAASRVHLRAHHASDVLAGLVIGGGLAIALGPAVRRLAGTTPREVSSRAGS